ncbi:MAG: hypothetical protein HY238_14295 [Acidobacteria bacterium]|nr:hypothetical protein [Acidobacteriota bacterium]
MSKGNPFLALRLSPETIERLREMSVRQGRHVSDVAREALATGLLSDPAAASIAAAVRHDTHRVAQRRSRSRKPSRIQRALTALEDLRQLLAEYVDWQASLPEFAEGSATGEKLDAAVEALEVAVDALEQLDLPRGYGRD